MLAEDREPASPHPFLQSHSGHGALGSQLQVLPPAPSLRLCQQKVLKLESPHKEL